VWLAYPLNLVLSEVNRTTQQSPKTVNCAELCSYCRPLLHTLLSTFHTNLC